jgi:hypothetical protein
LSALAPTLISGVEEDRWSVDAWLAKRRKPEEIE